jgi:hypothetical protein
MARREQVVTSDWIKATSDGLINVEGSPETMVVTISNDKITTHAFDDGRKQRVLKFLETGEKKFGANTTNWDSIAAISGQPDDDDWKGTRIELIVVPEPKSPTGHAIRVRKPKATASPARSGVLGAAVAEKLAAALTAKYKSTDDLRAYLRLVGVDPIATADQDPTLWPIAWVSDIQNFTRDPELAMKAAKAVAADDIPF